jgi:putative ABC transport system substrate-binding protein
MRRRDFIILIGTAAVWPAAAIAQQNNKKWLIGIITVFNDKEMTPAYAAFRARLRELGWVEGQNVAFDVRATSGDYTKLDTEAGSLIAASADVIVAQGTASLAATKRYTKTIPVVFNQVSDPVGQRLIDSLAHPGGNVTGLTNFEFASASKWIELLLELDRRISQVMLITNPANENTAQFVNAIAAAGDTKKVAVRVASIRDAVDVQDAIENYSKRSGGGLIIFPDGQLINNRELIVELAAIDCRQCIPSGSFRRSAGFYRMDPVLRRFSVGRPNTWTRYSRAPDPQICRSSSPPNSNWSSTLKPARRLD